MTSMDAAQMTAVRDWSRRRRFIISHYRIFYFPSTYFFAPGFFLAAGGWGRSLSLTRSSLTPRITVLPDEKAATTDSTGYSSIIDGARSGGQPVEERGGERAVGEERERHRGRLRQVA